MSPFTANIAANGGVGRAAAGHNGFKWLKPAENKFTQSAFTSFSMQVSANLHNFRFRVPELHIQNLSNRCRCKYDPIISRIFWILFLAGFCNLTQLCGGSSISTELSHSLIPLGEALLAFLCLLVLLRFLPCALHELHESSAHYARNGLLFYPKIKLYIFLSETLIIDMQGFIRKTMVLLESEF